MMFETLADVVATHARERPQRAAIIAADAAGDWSFADLDARVNRCVALLKAHGIGAGDRVGWLALNHPDFITLMCACFRVGAVLVAINARLVAREIAYILTDAGIGLLVSENGFAGLVDDACTATGLPCVFMLDGPRGPQPAFADALAACAPDAACAAITPDTIALQLYTSGTTGFPKGALLSHRQLLGTVDKGRQTGEAWGQWAADDVALVAMPLFHIGGTGWALHALEAGAAMVILPRPDIAGIVEAIARHRISRLFAVPAVLNAICLHLEAAPADLSCVAALYYGASPIPLDVLRRSMAAFPNAQFVQCYGATETCGTVVYLPPHDHDPAGNARMRGCGKPFPGNEVKIIDGDGRVLGPGEVGEICIRSVSVMAGYHNRPDATAKAIVDGWYHTGDAGYRDADGYLFIHDRVKDMIVSGGENVYPAEVENALFEHPAVADCAVIGVPDARWGEAVKAIVVTRAGVTADELIAFARARIAGFKVPKSVEFTDVLPRNPSGKILKKDLRAPYWEGRERQVN